MSSDMKKLEEEIESDNELPSDYVDIPDIPAYKNDSRFESVKFPWLSKLRDRTEIKDRQRIQDQKIIPLTLYSILNKKTVQEKMENITGEKLLITKGVLNQRDIFCLKSIETINCDETLLWLINFFMYKDMQEDYKFLRTCLVDKNISIKHDNNKINKSCPLRTHHYEILALQ